MEKMLINYSAIWSKAVDDQEEILKPPQGTPRVNDSRICRLAFGTYKLHCFCERLAADYASPWMQLNALDAGHLYLLNKHHWVPDFVKKLNLDDLLLLLHEELVGMRLTAQEWLPVDQWTSDMECHSNLAESAPNP